MAGICSFSTALPGWAAALGACSGSGAAAAAERTQLVSFVGGGLGAVRQALFAHFEAHPWPQLRIVHGHLSPKAYMHVLRTSRFCLVRHMRTRTHTHAQRSLHRSHAPYAIAAAGSTCAARRCRARG